jgi:hypothetical protein
MAMSMYSELLAGLCADVDPLPLPVSRDELVVILLQCRRRLDEQDGDGEHMMAEDLALELDHDRMLLRLCTAMGIESEPERFGNPLVERERLESQLRAVGVDFRTLDDHRRMQVA